MAHRVSRYTFSVRAVAIEHAEYFGISVNNTKEIILVRMIMLSFLRTKFNHSVLKHFLVFVLEMMENTYVAISSVKDLFTVVKQNFVFEFFLASAEVVKPRRNQQIMFLYIIPKPQLLLIQIRRQRTVTILNEINHIFLLISFVFLFFQFSFKINTTCLSIHS